MSRIQILVARMTQSLMPQDAFSFNTNLVDRNGLKDQVLKGGSSKGGLEGSLRGRNRRKIRTLILLCSNVSYGALFYGKETLPVVSKPEGADCTLKNNKGSWEVKTPATVKLKLSKKDLEIVCEKDGYKTKILTLPLKTKVDVTDTVYSYDSGDEGGLFEKGERLDSLLEALVILN